MSDRPVQAANDTLLEGISKYGKGVPIIIVGTKKDKYRNMLKGEIDDDEEDGDEESRKKIVLRRLHEREIAIEDMLRNVEGAVYEAVVFVSNSMWHKRHAISDTDRRYRED
jgi:hypothetical protein